MSRILLSVVVVVMFEMSVFPGGANACPNCREAVSTGSVEEETDRVRESTAWNQNILMMIAVPYCLVGVVGFMIYRNLRSRPLEVPEPITEEEDFPV